MSIIEKFSLKAKDNINNLAVTIAFLGDSVTQGCFELYKKQNGAIETFFDKNGAYHMYFSRILSILYPSVPVNIINAGISGDTAQHGYERLERDVLRYNPDLTVVCFGLNDVRGGLSNVNKYITALKNIFNLLKSHNSEVIFLTPNMMNTKISDHIIDDAIKKIAADSMAIQNDGILDYYIDEAKMVCNECNVKVCDCYTRWKKLYASGVDTTELLANKINHPSREMNWMFAYYLVETMFDIK